MSEIELERQMLEKDYERAVEALSRAEMRAIIAKNKLEDFNEVNKEIEDGD